MSTILLPWGDPAEVSTIPDVILPWGDPAQAVLGFSTAVVLPWGDPAAVNTLDAGQSEWQMATPGGLVPGRLYAAQP